MSLISQSNRNIRFVATQGATRQAAAHMLSRELFRAALLFAASMFGTAANDEIRADESPAHAPYRSPVDVALLAGDTLAVSANQTSGSVSLIRLADGVVLDEQPVGARPVAIVADKKGRRVFVTCAEAGDVVELGLSGDDNRLNESARVHTGMEPHGLALSPDEQTAYVALSAADQIATVDLATGEVSTRIDVGRWPRYVALTADGRRLAVGTSGSRGVSIIDIPTGKMIHLDQFVGLNIGHMQTSRDGRYAWFPFVVYRRNPITVGNIRLGWVLATRLARIRLDEPDRREAMSLDPQGEAVGDPHGLALTPDESQVVVSASGTHELLVFRTDGLPLESLGSTDHIDRSLLLDRERFARVPVGGRPMGLRITSDGKSAVVANYIDDSVQVVDLTERRLVQTIPLRRDGDPAEEAPLERRGEALFYDARLSLDQWYSCHTCHYEGGTNSIAIDTLNDGTIATYKTVLPLHHVVETPPWTWHGWQTDVRDAMKASIKNTMQGKPATEEEVDSLIAYLKTLRMPPNPRRTSIERRERLDPSTNLRASGADDAAWLAAVERGRAIFEGDRGACATCHRGPLLTDGENHDVGVRGPNDRYEGFNTPSLVGIWRKVLFLHDGRADTLRDALTGAHDPAKVSGVDPLSPEELDDLIEYLRSL